MAKEAIDPVRDQLVAFSDRHVHSECRHSVAWRSADDDPATIMAMPIQNASPRLESAWAGKSSGLLRGRSKGDQDPQHRERAAVALRLPFARFMMPRRISEATQRTTTV